MYTQGWAAEDATVFLLLSLKLRGWWWLRSSERADHTQAPWHQEHTDWYICRSGSPKVGSHTFIECYSQGQTWHSSKILPLKIPSCNAYCAMYKRWNFCRSASLWKLWSDLDVRYHGPCPFGNNSFVRISDNKQMTAKKIKVTYKSCEIVCVGEHKPLWD